MANRNGQAKYLARRGVKNVQSITLVSKEWITILTCVNAARHWIPNFYIFKEVRHTKNYNILCEEGSIQGLQIKRWILTTSAIGWTTSLFGRKRKVF